MNAWAEPLTRRRRYTTAPRTWVPGELVTAGMMNSIRDCFLDIEAGRSSIAGSTAPVFRANEIRANGLVASDGASVHSGTSMHVGTTLHVAQGIYATGIIHTGTSYFDSAATAGYIVAGLGGGVGQKHFSLQNDGGIVHFGIENNVSTAFGALPHAGVMFSSTYYGLDFICQAPTAMMRFVLAGAERMRLHASGGLSIGDANAPGVNSIRCYNAAGANLTLAATQAGTSSIFFPQDGVNVWSIVVGTGHAGNIHFQNLGQAQNAVYITQGGIIYGFGFVNQSDRRLKKNLRPYDDTSVLSRLTIHAFEWIRDGSYGRGLVAQDAIEIVPHAVNEGSNDIDPQTGEYTTTWGIDYSKLVPDLIVGWQKHEARIAALEKTHGRLAS